MNTEKIVRTVWDTLGASAAWKLATRRGCCKMQTKPDIVTTLSGIVAAAIGYTAADKAFDFMIGKYDEFKSNKEDKDGK